MWSKSAEEQTGLPWVRFPCYISEGVMFLKNQQNNLWFQLIEQETPVPALLPYYYSSFKCQYLYYDDIFFFFWEGWIS